MKTDFPTLANNSELVYLDSAASTQTHQSVLDRMNKFYEEVVLLNQKYVIDPSLTISKLLENTSSEKECKITINSFTRYELGQ